MGEDELNITYESLFDILRREKNREELQKLDKSFTINLIEYLRSKENIIQTKQSELFSMDYEKTKIQIKNIKKIIRELFEKRQRKIVNMAIYKARTTSSFIDTTALLDEEIPFYNELVRLMQIFNDDIINSLILSQQPIKIVESLMQREENRKTTENQKIEEREQESLQKNTAPRFIHPVPRFLSKEQEVFGPYEEDEIATLPHYLAEILIIKGRAEAIDIKNS